MLYTFLYLHTWFFLWVNLLSAMPSEILRNMFSKECLLCFFFKKPFQRNCAGLFRKFFKIWFWKFCEGSCRNFIIHIFQKKKKNKLPRIYLINFFTGCFKDSFKKPSWDSLWNFKKYLFRNILHEFVQKFLYKFTLKFGQGFLQKFT